VYQTHADDQVAGLIAGDVDSRMVSLGACNDRVCLRETFVARIAALGDFAEHRGPTDLACLFTRLNGQLQDLRIRRQAVGALEVLGGDGIVLLLERGTPEVELFTSRLDVFDRGFLRGHQFARHRKRSEQSEPCHHGAPPETTPRPRVRGNVRVGRG
jgi:hypothetical protein